MDKQQIVDTASFPAEDQTKEKPTEGGEGSGGGGGGWMTTLTGADGVGVGVGNVMTESIRAATQAASSALSAAASGFTDLADSAPHRFAGAARSLGDAGSTASVRFRDGTDSTAEHINRLAGEVRTKTGGVVDVTGYIGTVGGSDLIPPAIGLAYLVLLVLLRLAVRLLGLDSSSRRNKRGRSRRALHRPSRVWSVRSALSGSTWDGDEYCGGGESGVFYSTRTGMPTRSNQNPGGESLLSLPSVRHLTGASSSGNRTATGPMHAGFASPTSTQGSHAMPQVRPLKLLGPTHTTLSYITSTPPPEVPAIFSSSKYRSIHRKLIIDVRRLTLGRCAPKKHPEVEVKSREGEGMSKYKAGRLMVTGGYLSADTTHNTAPVPTPPGGRRGGSADGHGHGHGEGATTTGGPSTRRSGSGATETDDGEAPPPPLGYESLLPPQTQSFHPPKVLPITTVLNASAVTPPGCGTLELTIDKSSQEWEKVLREEVTDPNKIWGHVVTVENWHGGALEEFLDGPGAADDDDDDDQNDGRQQGREEEDSTDHDGGDHRLTERGLGAPTVIRKESERGGEETDPNKIAIEEYTFESAREAAEFQSVVLALRIAGAELRNMYSALELLQMSSEAYDGDEVVLDHAAKEDHLDSAKGGGGGEDADEAKAEDGSEEDGRKPTAGVALDDVLRCLGEIPSIRRNLDRYYAFHYPDDPQYDWDNVSDDGTNGSLGDVPRGGHLLTEAAEGAATAEGDGDDYKSKRLLLGIVDFIRLFVPPPEAGSAPRPNPTAARESGGIDGDGGIGAHKGRVVSAVTLRKRVARAALRVKWYVAGMRVVRDGWNVPSPVPGRSSEEKGLPIYQRRLPYDEDSDNRRRDVAARNEYYEAIVGRDIRSDVHGERHLAEKGSSRPSGYQAYSLVGWHIFRLPDVPGSAENLAHPLQANNDPVLALPSLRAIIERNPDLDFYVQVFIPEEKGMAIAMLFVRTMPPGVDTKFDNVVDTFTNGGNDVRDRKLKVFLQLGPGSELSTLAWAFLKVLSVMRRVSSRAGAKASYVSDGGRTSFPGMRLSRYTQTRHFGGSLQTNHDLPTNYVAATSRIDEGSITNYLVNILYKKLEEGALPHCVVDFSFVLGGETAEELPERVLGTVRVVHMDAVKCALPIAYSSAGDVAPTSDNGRSNSASDTPGMQYSSWLWSSRATQTSKATDEGEQEKKDNDGIESRGHSVPDHGGVMGSDPYKPDIEALEEILDGVTVPVRKISIGSEGNGTRGGFAALGNDAAGEQHSISSAIVSPRTADGAKIEDDELFNVPVLENMGTEDLRRYYVASDGDLKTAAIRIVESAAWRGLTFPIDTRVCRVELRSGQFFQQGRDKEGNPVFYFRNMCLGPWRKDIDATSMAVFHRLETAMKQLVDENSEVRCTVVLFMGKPIDEVAVINEDEDKEVDGAGGENPPAAKTEDDTNDKGEKVEKKKQRNPFFIGADPRIDPDEEYYIHTNFPLVQRLVEVVSKHYPERLAKALIVPSGGFIKTLGTFGLRAYVPAPRTRARVTMLNTADDLKKFISEESLVAFAGGKAILSPAAFECGPQ